MTTKSVFCHTTDHTKTEVVRTAEVWSDSDRAMDKTNYYVVTLLVGRSGFMEPLGEWDQSKQAIDAGTPIHITGVSSLNYKMPDDAVVEVRVEKVGSPDSEAGLSMIIRIDVVGDVVVVDEPRGSFAHRSDISSPLVDIGGPKSPAEDILEEAANTVLRPSWTVPVPLHGLFS